MKTPFKAQFPMVNDQWSMTIEKSRLSFFCRTNAFSYDGAKLIALTFNRMNVIGR